jgi:hypothetical protein
MNEFFSNDLDGEKMTTTWSLAKELDWPADDLHKYAKEMARRDGYDSVYRKVRNSKGKCIWTLTPRAVDRICTYVAGREDLISTFILQTNVVFVRRDHLAQLLNVDVDVVDELADRVSASEGVVATYVMAEDHKGRTDWQLTPHAARCIRMKVRLGELS